MSEEYPLTVRLTELDLIVETGFLSAPMVWPWPLRRRRCRRRSSSAAWAKGCPRPELPSRRIPVDPRSKVVQSRAKKLAKDLLRASTGRLGEALCPPSTKLVIFSRGRTGSNLLVWLLKSHPQIRHHGEVLGETFLRHDFYRNEINRIGVVPYFERVTRRFFTERVVGVKFLYYQLEPEYARRWNVPDIPNLLPVLEARKDLRIIHLKRRNRLATLVSWKLAQHTDRWEAFRAGGRSRSVQSPELVVRRDHAQPQL